LGEEPYLFCEVLYAGGIQTADNLLRGVFSLRKLMFRLLPGFRLILLLGLGLRVCLSLQAGRLGDEAPELQIKEWVQGGSINLKVGSRGRGIPWMT